MAGWNGLAGASTPLKDGAPTNFNFVSSDYNRETGLLGNGTTKYLNSNRANNSDPQNNNHNAVYITNAVTGVIAAYIGADGTTAGANTVSQSTGIATFRCRSSGANAGANHTTGFAGVSRNSSSQFEYRFRGSTEQGVITSTTPTSDNVLVFARGSGGAVQIPTASRMSFYSIGESVDLAKLDSRVTNLMSNIATAIP
jgi:hypothetical protein